MSKAQHTPGPMVVEFNTAELPFRVYSQTTQGNVGYFHAEADANVFAAAPELLALAEAVRDSGLIPEWSGLGKAARAAIAKAKGE